MSSVAAGEEGVNQAALFLKGGLYKTNGGRTLMKIGIIIETKEFEKAWNALRFANTASRNGHEVKVFLMGEAVECENQVHEKYNVKEQLEAFAAAGGVVFACGTCLKSRGLEGTETCPVSTMTDCLNMVEWADKLLSF
jgi:sulfur relay (sulfurtransferase) complex TusBCD TusD component (DsrE family)